MKRFTFGLQKILELREYRERETKIELGKAVGALTQLEHKIAIITEERIRVTEEQFAPGRSTADIVAFDRYILRLDNTKTVFLEEAAKAERKVEEAQEIYLEVSRDSKILDNVKERRQREYRKFIIAEETKVLDDISNGAKARKLANGEL